MKIASGNGQNVAHIHVTGALVTAFLCLTFFYVWVSLSGIALA